MQVRTLYLCGGCSTSYEGKAVAEKCCLPEFAVGQVWESATGTKVKYAVIYLFDAEYLYYVTSIGTTDRASIEVFVQCFTNLR